MKSDLKDGASLSTFVQGYWRLADWNMSPQERLSFLKGHLELGVTSADHADIYGDYRCEELFGEALALDPSVRDEIEIVSKCGIMLKSGHYPERHTKHYDTSAGHIIGSVENSLSRLGTDRLDLLLIHRPDPLMQADEVAMAFSGLREAGKVLHFGVSNFTPEQFDLLQTALDFELVTNQVEINPWVDSILDDGVLEHCQKHYLRPMAWSCLGGGKLFGEDDAAGKTRDALMAAVSEQGDYSVDQALFAWVRTLPSNPVPIIGSGRLERVAAAVASHSIRFSREAWFSVLEAARATEVP